MSAFPTRAEVIEALSWWEDLERGRWGTDYATAVIDHLVRAASQTSAPVDAPPEERATSPSAQQRTQDLAASAPDPAADVASPTTDLGAAGGDP